MKNSMDVVRLVFFVLAGIGLYFYAGNVLASHVNESKPMINMTVNKSYEVWDAVNKLEDPWYVTKDPESLQIVSLNQKKSDKLRGLVRGYEELASLAEELIKARGRGDLVVFSEQKEKVAKILRPIWLQEAYKERDGRRAKGWVEWIKDNIMQAMHRLYTYFSSSKSVEVKTKFVGKVDEKTGKYVVTSVSQ